MSLTKTLNKNATSLANSGIVAIQPSEYFTNKSLDSFIEIPVSSKNISTLTTQNLLNVLDDITNVCPVQQNTILSNKIWTRYNTKQRQLTDKKNIFKNYIKQQNSFEELTGVSSERPEIIMLTDFVPLFVNKQNVNNLSQNSYKNSYFTNEGQFVDAKFNMEQLTALEIDERLKFLSARTNKTLSSTYSKFVLEKKDFQNKISDLKTLLGNISQLIKTFNSTKQLFDLRNFNYNISYDDNMSILNQLTIENYYKNSVQESLLNTIATQLPTNISLVNVLSQFGYSKNAIKNNFTSTKIWLQTIFEFKNILENYSYKIFDQNIDTIRNDIASNKINKPVNTINFNLKLINLSTDVPTINSIISTIPATLHRGTQQPIMKGFSELSESFQDLLDKFVLFTWIFSKEYRFSNGLAQTSTRQTLLNDFGYQVQTKNNLLFNNVFGHDQQSIENITNGTGEDNRICALAYSIINNKHVLNFETQQIETTKTNFSAGGEVYIDELLNTVSTSETEKFIFDTKQIENLINRLSICKNAINILANNMNWLCIPMTDNVSAITQQTERIITSPIDLFTHIHTSFIDNQANKIKIEYQTDPMTAIFAFASSDQQLKSLLFILCIFQIFKLENNTVDNVTYQSILQNISSYIKFLSTTSKFNQHNKSSKDKINISTIIEMLNLNTSKVWQQTLSIMKNIYLTLVENNEVVTLSKTRYSGINDSVMLMLIFDIIISLIEKYSILTLNTNFVLNSQVTFSLVNITSQESITSDTFSVYDKINFERSQVISGFVAIVGTLHALQMKLQSFVNYTHSQQVQTTIKTYLTTALQTISDQRMIKLLFTEQQMMLNVSTIYDLFARVSTRQNNGADFNKDGKIDDNDLFLSLDESLITPKLRNYFNILFSDSAFASDLGNKNILTIGIPCGFVENLKQKILNSTMSVKSKQTDIIKINVYKTDIQRPEFVFKPLTFLFELSRFPVRNSNLLVNLTQTSTIQDVIKFLPTRDILQNSNIANDMISFGKITTDITNLMKSKALSEYSSQVAFNSDEYNFLSSGNKNELLVNHALSYMLELYIKALTDLNVGDYKFVIDSNQYDIQTKKDLAQELVKQMLQDIVSQQTNKNVNGKLFSKQSLIITTLQLNVNKNINQLNNISQLINLLTEKQLKQITQELIKINKFVNSTTSLSSASSVISSIISPKQFDRVFNIIVDSNDFELDIQKLKLVFNSRELTNLINSGEIVQTNTPINKFQTTLLQQKNTNTQNNNFYKQRNKNKNNGDIIFEKYYVTIDTFGEDII
jgi:hypothetical protein